MSSKLDYDSRTSSTWDARYVFDIGPVTMLNQRIARRRRQSSPGVYRAFSMGTGFL